MSGNVEFVVTSSKWDDSFDDVSAPLVARRHLVVGLLVTRQRVITRGCACVEQHTEQFLKMFDALVQNTVAKSHIVDVLIQNSIKPNCASTEHYKKQLATVAALYGSFIVQALADNASLSFVKPDWIYACHDAQKYMPHQKYVITPCTV